MLESLFNKVAGLQTCFPLKFAKFLRTPILKNICKRLFLDLVALKNNRKYVLRNDKMISSNDSRKLEMPCSSKSPVPDDIERKNKKLQKSTILCGGKEGNLKVWAFWLDAKIRQCASILEDNFLRGNMVALDAIYHVKWLIASKGKFH